MRLLCCTLLLTACGRIGFDSSSDASVVDARSTLDVKPSSYSAAVVASGPLFYYRFEETAGPVAADAMASGRDGRYDFDSGTLTQAQPGALGDSSSSVRVEGDGNTGPAITASVRFETSYVNWDGDFTVELFVKPNAVPPAGWHESILICETYNIDGFRFGWDIDGLLEIWTDEAGAAGALSTTTSIDYSRFNHIALVRRGSRFSIVVDGVIAATDPTFDYIPTTVADSECGIGSFHGVPSYATFDELAVYGRALDEGELAAHLSAR